MASRIAGTALKKSTGLTGLAVAVNPHETLAKLYGKTLHALQQMPSTAAYRKYTEQIINERSQIVKAEPDIFAVEKKINSGQIEELIIQAENELLLARKMLDWKPWEPLQTPNPPNQWKWPI